MTGSRISATRAVAQPIKETETIAEVSWNLDLALDLTETRSPRWVSLHGLVAAVAVIDVLAFVVFSLLSYELVILTGHSVPPVPRDLAVAVGLALMIFSVAAQAWRIYSVEEVTHTW